MFGCANRARPGRATVGSLGKSELIAARSREKAAGVPTPWSELSKDCQDYAVDDDLISLPEDGSDPVTVVLGLSLLNRMCSESARRTHAKSRSIVTLFG